MSTYKCYFSPDFKSNENTIEQSNLVEEKQDNKSPDKDDDKKNKNENNCNLRLKTFSSLDNDSRADKSNIMNIKRIDEERILIGEN